MPAARSASPARSRPREPAGRTAPSCTSTNRRSSSSAASVVAVILHEISHGVVALWFGDRTAKEAGRITLNPVPHIDPFGSIVLPAMGAIVGLPVLAYAKPVPVNPSRLRKPRRDMLCVSLAGPASNFLLMITFAARGRGAVRPRDRAAELLDPRPAARRADRVHVRGRSTCTSGSSTSSRSRRSTARR